MTSTSSFSTTTATQRRRNFIPPSLRVLPKQTIIMPTTMLANKNNPTDTGRRIQYSENVHVSHNFCPLNKATLERIA